MEKPLKYLRKELYEIVDNLKWTIEAGTNSNFKKITNLKLFRKLIIKIGSLNLFNNYIDEIKKSSIFDVSSDETQIPTPEAKSVNAVVDKLSEALTVLLEAIETVVVDEEENSINIKLPHVVDFDELSKISRDIHVALTQVIYDKEIKGETKIISVENGSIWINVFLACAAAVNIVAAMAWSAAVIYKKYQEGQILKKQVESLDVKNESLKDILQAQKKETKLIIDAETEHINSTYFSQEDPERISRIRNSIERLANLIKEGAEIHPSFVAHEEVSNLFPDPKKMIGIESKIKKLTNPEGI